MSSLPSISWSTFKFGIASERRSNSARVSRSPFSSGGIVSAARTSDAAVSVLIAIVCFLPGLIVAFSPLLTHRQQRRQREARERDGDDAEGADLGAGAVVEEVVDAQRQVVGAGRAHQQGGIQL